MEYERIRYKRLNVVIKKALEQTIKKLMLEQQFNGCYPVIASMDGGPEALEAARTQIQKFFHSTCIKQFDLIFRERDVERKLDELDDIIQSAQRRRESSTEAPLDVGKLTPQELIAASVGQSKVDAIKKLTMIYDQLVLDNQQFHKELRSLAEESETLTKDIVLLVEALSSGMDELKRQNVDSNLDALTQEVLGG